MISARCSECHSGEMLEPKEKSKYLDSGGSMVARLKLKGIDGRAPQVVYSVA